MNEILSLEKQIFQLAEYIHGEDVGLNYVVYTIDKETISEITDTDSVGLMFIRLLEIKKSLTEMLERYRQSARIIRDKKPRKM